MRCAGRRAGPLRGPSFLARGGQRGEHGEDGDSEADSHDGSLGGGSRCESLGTPLGPASCSLGSREPRRLRCQQDCSSRHCPSDPKERRVEVAYERPRQSGYIRGRPILAWHSGQVTSRRRRDHPPIPTASPVCDVTAERRLAREACPAERPSIHPDGHMYRQASPPSATWKTERIPVISTSGLGRLVSPRARYDRDDDALRPPLPARPARRREAARSRWPFGQRVGKNRKAEPK
jgi:hypothetical protein